MNYAWMITADHFAAEFPDQRSDVGVTGPSTATGAQVAALRLGTGTKFRMRDGDNGLVYEGLLLGDSESEDGFGPLDDFGAPNFGCTCIEYWRDTKWEVL